jgi:hypothetical protein
MAATKRSGLGSERSHCKKWIAESFGYIRLRRRFKDESVRKKDQDWKSRRFEVLDTRKLSLVKSYHALLELSNASLC